jgi:predicted transcriptional regulator
MTKINIGELEQEVMKILWESDVPMKPKEVQSKLLPRELAYTTVMTIMGRLSDKGLLSRHDRNGAYYYYPAVNRDTFASENLKGVFSGLVSSYGEVAISQFIDTIKDDPASIKALEAYLSKLKPNEG